MNDRYYRDNSFLVCRPCEKHKTLDDLQKDMKKLNRDIDALKEMDLDCTTMYKAIDELKAKKTEVLKQMHEELDRMYA